MELCIRINKPGRVLHRPKLLNCIYIAFIVQVMESDVDFWKISEEQLKLRQKSGAYPPSFAIHAIGGTENDILKITFSGSSRDSGLTTEVHLPVQSVHSGILSTNPIPYGRSCV